MGACLTHSAVFPRPPPSASTSPRVGGEQATSPLGRLAPLQLALRPTPSSHGRGSGEPRPGLARRRPLCPAPDLSAPRPARTRATAAPSVIDWLPAVRARPSTHSAAPLGCPRKPPCSPRHTCPSVRPSAPSRTGGRGPGLSSQVLPLAPTPPKRAAAPRQGPPDLSDLSPRQQRRWRKATGPTSQAGQL